MKRWSIIRCRMSTLLLPTIYNGQQNIYKKYSSIWYLHTKAKILIDWLIEASHRPVQNSYVCKLWYTERKKLSHFDIKSKSLAELKFDPAKWVTGEYLSQIDSTESNWLNIESQIDSTFRVKLAQHWESNWLNIESQIGPTLRVKLTQYWESNWLNIDSQIDSNILQLLTLPGRIIIPPVTELLRSK